jgi:signal transduction histidine kinase
MIVQRLPTLHVLDRSTLIDHLPEFLVGLAAWIEGDEAAGKRGFEVLAEGHALQRLGHGIQLEVLTTEYALLRLVLQKQLLRLECTDEVRQLVIRVNEGLDYATSEAVHRYSARRDEVRERFISILGHDLRNPLSSIVLASAGIAAVPCTHAKHGSNASIIQRAAERMQRMIGDVMDFAHAHLGEGIPATPVACDISALAIEAAHELQLAHPGRDIRVDTSGDLRGYWDRDRVIQALSNLIGNAIQHGVDPIRVMVEEQQPDRLAVITRVTNHGETLDAAQLAQLFEPFGPHSDRGRRSGLGLGLFIVQQIAIAHGALCTVTSADGVTSFEIIWPRVPVDKVSDR